MVRSTLQRGRSAVAPCPQVRAEALDYEPHVESKKPPVETENLRRKPKKSRRFFPAGRGWNDKSRRASHSGCGLFHESRRAGRSACGLFQKSRSGSRKIYGFSGISRSLEKRFQRFGCCPLQ